MRGQNSSFPLHLRSIGVFRCSIDVWPVYPPVYHEAFRLLILTLLTMLTSTALPHTGISRAGLLDLDDEFACAQEHG